MSNTVNTIMRLFALMRDDERRELFETIAAEIGQSCGSPTEVEADVGTLVTTEIEDSWKLWGYHVTSVLDESTESIKAFSGSWVKFTKEGKLTDTHKHEIADDSLVLLSTKASEKLLVGLRYKSDGDRRGVVTERGVKRLPRGDVLFSVADKKVGVSKAKELLAA